MRNSISTIRSRIQYYVYLVFSSYWRNQLSLECTQTWKFKTENHVAKHSALRCGNLQKKGLVGFLLLLLMQTCKSYFIRTIFRIWCKYLLSRLVRSHFRHLRTCKWISEQIVSTDFDSMSTIRNNFCESINKPKKKPSSYSTIWSLFIIYTF